MPRDYLPKKDYSYDLQVYWILRDLHAKYFLGARPAARRRSLRSTLVGLYNRLPKAYKRPIKLSYKLAVFVVCLPVILPALLLYYTLFAVLALKFGADGDAADRDRRDQRALFELLYPKWCRLPITFIIKFEESYLFSREAIVAPSMEIGCQYGEHSEKVFRNKTIDVAMECDPSCLWEFTEPAARMFGRKVCADAYTLPFPSDGFGTILLINSLDDFQRGCDAAVAEFSRVLKPGGRLVFSLFTKAFEERSILTRLNPSRKLFAWNYKGVHNFLDLAEIEHLLARNQLQLTYFKQLIQSNLMTLLEMIWILERHLVLTFSFKAAFAPVVTLPGLGHLYKELLFRLCRASLSQSHPDEPGALLYVVATKRGEPAGAAKRLDVVCPLCVDQYLHAEELEPGLDTGRQALRCGSCQTVYPVIDGVPILHPEFRDFEGRADDRVPVSVG